MIWSIMMKLNKIIFIFLILIISLTFIGTISAENVSNLNLTSTEINYSSDSQEIISLDDGDEIIADDSCCSDSNDTSQTWVVEPDPTNPNQVQKPTVQPAIDNAKDGDTIILNGTFVHCHFTVNKNLTIIATPETTVGVCPHHNHPSGSSNYGIFYITEQGSGTVLDGFGFTNGYFNMAYDVFNPFGVFIDGASNVELRNLVFNWTAVQSTSYDPNDFKFNPIIVKNSHNITLTNIFFNNTNSLVSNINSTNVNLLNPTIINTEISEVNVVDVYDSNIVVSNLNINVGDSSKLSIVLRDGNNNLIANKTISVTIDGVTKTLTTDDNGSASLSVKYGSAATHYVFVSFLGDDEYKSSVANCKIVVNKKTTTITAPKSTLKVKKSKKISITLKSGGKVVANKKITLKVNGKTFSAKTNSKGIASVNVKLLKKGTFKYTVKFAGDSAFKSVSKTGKVIVKK